MIRSLLSQAILKRLARPLIFCFCYFLFAKTGDYLTFKPSAFTTFWLPSGLYVSVLLLTDTRRWPLMIAAAFCANMAFDIMGGKPPMVGFLFSCTNSMEALTGAFLTRRFISYRPTLSSLREVFGFMVFSAFFSTMIGATLGATIVMLAFEPLSYWATWRMWWSGDMVGILIVAPLILTWSDQISKRLKTINAKKTFEALVIFLLIILVSWLIFSSREGLFAYHNYPVALFIVYAAFRHGSEGTSLAIIVLSIVATWCAAKNICAPGWYDSAFENETITSLQAFFAVLSSTGLLIAATMNERNQAEKQIKENSKRLELALKGAELGMWDQDEVKDEYTLNKRAIEILERNIKTDTEWNAIIHPDDLRMVTDMDIQLKNAQIPLFDCEYRIITKTGDIKWIHDRGKVVERNSRGAQVRSSGTIQDITDQKRNAAEREDLLKQLEQSRKLEAIGTLSGGIAHDFNNILAIIIGNIELALENLPGKSPVYHNLEEIRTASFRARDIVRQLLSFSRETKHKRKPIKIHFVVKETLKLLRATIPSSIGIRQNIPDDIGPILADPTQIHQIVINLCTNAAQAFHENVGILDISLSESIIDTPLTKSSKEAAAGKYIKLTISDNGPGMEPEVLKRIFDPYFTTKEVGKGTGLGLSVVHGIVEDHGGIITVNSRIGKGTCFDIFFPVYDGDAAVELKTEKSTPSGSEKILFVDDEESITKMGRQILEDLGYRVTNKNNAVEALELLRADPGQFDIVITDMTMPNMTGDKLAKAILETRPDMPIILCTGFNDNIDAKKAKALGIRKYIEKPFTREQLSKTVREALDKC